MLYHVVNLWVIFKLSTWLRFESVKLCTKAFFQKRMLQLAKHWSRTVHFKDKSIKTVYFISFVFNLCCFGSCRSVGFEGEHWPKLKVSKFVFNKFSHISHCLKMLFSQTSHLHNIFSPVTNTGLLKRFIFREVINLIWVKFPYYKWCSKHKKQIAWR